MPGRTTLVLELLLQSCAKACSSSESQEEGYLAASRKAKIFGVVCGLSDSFVNEVSQTVELFSLVGIAQGLLDSCLKARMSGKNPSGRITT